MHMPTEKLTEAIKAYIKKRADTKFEKISKDLKSQQKIKLWTDAEFQQTLAEQQALINTEFYPNTWLTKAAERAKQINVVTHALKFTHSDAKGSGALAKKELAKEAHYLTTASINKMPLDIMGNAAALDVAGLLLISEDNQELMDYIFKSDTSPFLPLANNEEQAAQWLQGFGDALTDSNISSHTLAKQLYFPVNETYHLIAPLHATSMAHELYTRITDTRFSEDSVAARKAKREQKPFEHLATSYPNLAVQNFGGTKPQNISQLNSRRKGKTYLLSCQPPKWENQLALPQQHKDQFFKQYRQIVANKIKGLKKLLIAANIIEKNNVHIRNKRARLVGEIIDTFILFSMKIQQLKQFSGWSKTSKLSRAQQLWLDPYRDDKEFQEERETNDWQADIADEFALWLNKQLESAWLKMDDNTHGEWKKLLQHELGMLKDDIEVIST